MTVTFFGHRDTPKEIIGVLEELLRVLIENCGADTFYVGNHGAFDAYAASCLQKLKKKYEYIKWYTVLAYMPKKKNGEAVDSDVTVFPEELAGVVPRFAISKRNDWMLAKSDAVVVYCTYSFGGASQYYEKAKRKQKTVYNIAELVKQ